MHRFRFIILLAMLVLLMLIGPVADLLIPRKYPVLTQVTLAVVLVAMLCSAVVAVSENRKKTWLAIVLALPAVVLQMLDSVIDHEALLAWSSVADIVFLSFVIIVVLRRLFIETEVTTNVMCAAICIYLVLGIVWADVYSLVDIVEQGAFSYSMIDAAAEAMNDGALEEGDASGGRVCMRMRGRQAIYPMYFSFVTMTTLGFGDIIPCTSLSRALVSLQAMMGQLYLAVLVARLVGLHVTHSLRESAGPSAQE